MATTQGVIKRVAAKNPNAKYRVKYSYSLNQTAEKGVVKTKYSYSKTFILLTKKYLLSM